MDVVIISASLMDSLFASSPLKVEVRIGYKINTSTSRSITIRALINTGCTAYAIVDLHLAQQIEETLQISRMPLLKPKRTRAYNGKSSVDITHAIYPATTVLNHY